MFETLFCLCVFAVLLTILFSSLNSFRARRIGESSNDICSVPEGAWKLPEGTPIEFVAADTDQTAVSDDEFEIGVLRDEVERLREALEIKSKFIVDFILGVNAGSNDKKPKAKKKPIKKIKKPVKK